MEAVGWIFYARILRCVQLYMLCQGEGIVNIASDGVLQGLQIYWEGQRIYVEEKIVGIMEEDSPCESVALVYVDVDYVGPPISAQRVRVAESIGSAVPGCSEIFLPQGLIHQRDILLKAKLHKYHFVQAQSVLDDASTDVSGCTTDLLESIKPSGGGHWLFPAPKGGVESDNSDGRWENEGRVTL